MEELHRVDIKLSKDVLRWAAVEAAKLGISRRQYLSNCINRWRMLSINGAKKIILNPLIPDECIETKSE